MLSEAMELNKLNLSIWCFSFFGFISFHLSRFLIALKRLSDLQMHMESRILAEELNFFSIHTRISLISPKAITSLRIPDRRRRECWMFSLSAWGVSCSSCLFLLADFTVSQSKISETHSSCAPFFSGRSYLDWDHICLFINHIYFLPLDFHACMHLLVLKCLKPFFFDN